MMGKKKNICVLDINNVQEEYSYALEFIKIFENSQMEEEYRSKLDSIRVITEKIAIRGGQVEEGISPIYYEKILERKDPKTQKIIERVQLSKDVKDLKYSMFKYNSMSYFANGEMLYHIRIHTGLERDDFLELQYLALLLQELNFLFEGITETRKRLSIFMVPHTGDEYPFLDIDNNFDNETYYKASKYLHLLSSEYKGVIYGAFLEKNNQVNIKALNFKINIQPEDYFPMMPMNVLNYCDLFESCVSEQTLKDIFALVENPRKRKFREDSMEKMENPFYDYIAESSFRKLEKTLNHQQEKGAKELLPCILKILTAKKSKVYWMSFSLFCFMFHQVDVGRENAETQIQGLWELVQNLFDGIKQIVQNAIQHSEKKACVFSFYILEEQKLKILISDLNYNKTMIEKFVETIETEYEENEDSICKKAILELKNKKDTIAIRNLFGEFKEQDPKVEWQSFRKQNSSAHVGLMLFGVNAIRCNARISVHSCTSYELKNSCDYYVCQWQNNESIEEQNTKLYKRVIPGTQYEIEIPIVFAQKNIPLGLGQLQDKNFIREDYEAYAEYLDYSEKEIECEKEFRAISYTLSDKTFISIAKKKLEVIKEWRRKWEVVLNNIVEKKVCFIDVKVLREMLPDSDTYEIFIKSFFEAIGSLDKKDIYALALINVDKEFMRVFKDTCIVFAARKFPGKLQLFVCMDNYIDSLILCGNTFYEAIHNGYLLSIEHGTHEIGVFEYARARDLFYKINSDNCNKQSSKDIKVVPFEAILSCNDNETIFDRRLEVMSNAEIDGEVPGYRISNTHMRLGSKVHIQSFYEMSFLFYRTSIANKIAFQILQNLLERKIFPEVNIGEDTLVFYGYASYSKAILTSVAEILNIYRTNKIQERKVDKIAFISYQHNLQSESEEIQMYYGFPEDFPAKIKDGRVIVDKPMSIIQIVPISSTLTTFEKMWCRLKKDIVNEDINKFKLAANYSVFWVKNLDDDFEKGKPSVLERKYWSKYDIGKHLIETRFKELDSKIFYFVKQTVRWHNPLSCPMCYPANLIDEIPLVETDQTSTVPTQQIRKRKQIKRNGGDLLWTDNRFLKLNESIVYGHIKRGKNHFQYYIDTQSYFYSVRDEVRNWLEECRKKDEEDFKQLDFPCIHIIFSPEHNTNVGFAQYVNTYYFGGIAEIVSINEDKEFRSNFECEHAALIYTIKELLANIVNNPNILMPIRFYFVDDTIISGESFQKANSFLRTLLPIEFKHIYSVNVISKCFLLVDRMSNDTKKNYVENVERDFYSFLHIDVSNVRTQGDSCVGCKLEKDAIRLFKRSSTNRISDYWLRKMTNFQAISYDDKEKVKVYQNKEAFQRLLISHISQNVMFVENEYYEYGDIYDSILTVAFKILGYDIPELKKRVNVSCDKLIQEVQGIQFISLFFKVISRPFFSFDFKVKLQVLTLLIILTEVLLGNEKQVKEYKCESEMAKTYKEFLLDKNRINLTVRLGKIILKELDTTQQVEFVKDCLIRCLADMRSTYLLRKKTVSEMYKYLAKKTSSKTIENIQNVEGFWRDYACYVHYIVDCSSDEMRSLGLEYLLLTGKEYVEFIDDAKKAKAEVFTPMFLYQSITGKKYPNKRDSFYVFCHELLLQNTRIHFDGVEKGLELNSEQDSYYMEQWSCIRALEKFKIYDLDDYPKNKSKVLLTKEEKDLFAYLRKENDNTNSLQEVKNKYDSLLRKIAEMICIKREISYRNVCMALLTLSCDRVNKSEINDLDILTEINAKEANARYEIKSRIVQMLNEEESRGFELHKDGYAIFGDNGKCPYIVIYFENQYNAAEKQIGRTMRTIAKVMLYISVEVNTEEEAYYYPRFILRDLMAYKNRLMRMLETDFASDMFTKYAHTTDEKNIFAHEKAINHNSIRDNDELQMLLEKHTVSERYDVLDYHECIKWLTLKNYVNEQIARLFNRCFRMESEKQNNENRKNGVSMEAPQLYIGNKENEYLSENPFCKKLFYFRELNFLQDDRFVLLMNIVHIEYENLIDAEMITKEDVNGDEKAYNQEYMKCLILDILFSAIKSGSYRPGFLEKINWYLKGEMWIAAKGMLSEEAFQELMDEQCVVKIYREQCANEWFDYLVFQNRVMLTIPNYEEANIDIKRRLQDPLDYSDGHMSLLTIKRYVEGLVSGLENKSRFEYAMEEGKLVFKTKLPILKKGALYEKNIYNR